MNDTGRKYLLGVFGALLCLTIWICMGLERGGTGDHVFVAVFLMAMAALAAYLAWMETRDLDQVILLLAPIGAAMLARALCMDHTTNDYEMFLCRWYAYFKTNGGFDAIAGSVGDYNVPYLYFMAAISYCDVPDLYLIKLFSILWDIVLAWGCLRLVCSLIRERQGSMAPLTAFGAALLLPTVVLNGAYWAQCDVIYGALAVHAAALVMEGRNKASVALMALAFSFKLQAVFVLPLWGMLWLSGKVKFRELWVFPLTYLAVILPAVMIGKPLGDILGIYFNQMGEYPKLVLNAPSVYQFIPYGAQLDQNMASGLGIIAAAALVLALLALGFLLRGRMERDTFMSAAVVLCIGVPFFLPHMHERYFFLADVFTLCWACANISRIPAAVLTCGASLASYCVYLRLKYNFVLHLGGTAFIMPLEALAMLAALVIAVLELAQDVKRNRGGMPI